MPRHNVRAPASSSPDATKPPLHLGPRPDPEQRRYLDDLFSTAYEELHRLASSVKRSHPGATTNPSGLVNAAWLRLADSLKLAPESELHFKRIAAQAMRHILVEAARRRAARKRGGNEAVLSFDEALGVPVSCDREVLAVHAALEELARLNPRQAEIIECRFFGGMEVSQTAETLGISAKTVDRDWRAAKAWLASRIRESR